MDEAIKGFYKIVKGLDIDRCVIVPEQLMENEFKNLELKIGKEFQKLYDFLEKNTETVSVDTATQKCPSIECSGECSGVTMTESYGLISYDKVPVGFLDAKIFHCVRQHVELGDLLKKSPEFPEMSRQAEALGISLEGVKLLQVKILHKCLDAGFTPEFLKENPLYISKGQMGRKREVEKVNFSRYYQ